MHALGRFVGLASTVSVPSLSGARLAVRTMGEALAEDSVRLARLVLTPAQLNILLKNGRLVFITGPPGTGDCLTYF